GETERRQAPNIWTKGNAREIELLGDVHVGIQIKPVRVQVVVAKPKFVDQVVAKSMHLARRQAPGGILTEPILKASAIEHVVEWRRQEERILAITEAAKQIVISAEDVIDADVKFILSFATLGIG